MTHSFDVNLAVKVGLNEAIFLNHMVFWHKRNMENKKSYFEGHYWTYNSIAAFLEVYPYLSERKLRTVIKKLEERGLIKVGNFNKKKFDRTRWYCLTKEGCALCQTPFVKTPNRNDETANGFGILTKPFVQKAATIPDSKPYNNTDKDVSKVKTLHLAEVSNSNSVPLHSKEDLPLNGEQKEEAETCAVPPLGDLSKEKLWKLLNKKDKKYFPDIVTIIDGFKSITGKKRTTYHNQGYIKALLYWMKKGYVLDDFEKVFQYKFNKFNGNPDQDEYINISTMCRQELFERNLELANRIVEKIEKNQRKQWQEPQPKMEILEIYRKGYEKTIDHLYKTWPNIWEEIRPFSMDEFTRLFHKKDPHSTHGWHAIKMHKEKFKPWLNGLLNRLNTSKWERQKYLNLGKLSIESIVSYEFSNL